MPVVCHSSTAVRSAEGGAPPGRLYLRVYRERAARGEDLGRQMRWRVGARIGRRGGCWRLTDALAARITEARRRWQLPPAGGARQPQLCAAGEAKLRVRA